MPFPTITYHDALDNGARTELEALTAQYQGYLSKEHNSDGTHGDITTGTINAEAQIRVDGADPNNTGVSQATVAAVDGVSAIAMTATDQTNNEAAGVIASVNQSAAGLIARNVSAATFRQVDEYPTTSDTADVTKFPWVVTGDVIPDTDDARYLGYLGLGNFVRRWRSLYFSRVVYGPLIVATTGFYERARTVAVGEWDTYTPTWTASSSNPSLGNGTIVGRFTRVGKTVTVSITLTMGSTTTYGTGNWRFSYPVAVRSSPDAAPDFGSGRAYDSSAPLRYVLSCLASSAGITCDADGFDPNVGPTIPFTWAQGDLLQLTITYEAAS